MMKIIEKTFQILQLFLDHGDELSLSDLSRLSGMNKPTTRRIALSLIECGLLSQQKSRGKYALGMKFIDFSQALKKQNHIVDVAEPFLNRLGIDTNETVAMAIWDGRHAVMCLSIHPNHPLKVMAYEGTMSGLHFNSLGKAILAELPPEELNTVLPETLNQFTPNTINNVNDLTNHLMLIKREGAAIDDEEGFSGVRGIGAAFRNNEGIIAGAITILGPSVRITREKLREYVPLVKDCAARISTALGFKPIITTQQYQQHRPVSMSRR